MIQPPKALGLFVCDQVIFDRGSQKPSLIGCFAGMAVYRIPVGAAAFRCLCGADRRIRRGYKDLTVTHLESEQEIYARRLSLRFPDPLRIVHFRYRVFDCDFPTAGAYLFALSAGELEIAACRVYVYERIHP